MREDVFYGIGRQVVDDRWVVFVWVHTGGILLRVVDRSKPRGARGHSRETVLGSVGIGTEAAEVQGMIRAGVERLMEEMG